jgi:hypothetical protein
LLSALVPTMSNLRDGETTSLDNNGSSILIQRLLERTNGRTTLLTCKATTSDADQLHQDGGRCSHTKMPSLPMRRVESWMSKVALIGKTETSLLIHFTRKSTNNGISFMLTNGLLSQRREK